MALVLSGSIVRLEALAHEHEEGLWDASRDERTWRWMSIHQPQLMLEHAFEQLGCLRVELKTDAGNERSRSAMAALPAQFEGVHRKWPDVRANLLRRLGR